MCGCLFGFDPVFALTYSCIYPITVLFLSYRCPVPLSQVRGVKSVCVDRFNRKILYGTAGTAIHTHTLPFLTTIYLALLLPLSYNAPPLPPVSPPPPPSISL